MRRALTILLSLAALVAGLLTATPAVAQAGAVAADPGPAQERLNRGRFETGTVPTPNPFPTVELSERGVFHLHSGVVHSQWFGARTPFPGAAIDWSPGPQSASAASGTGDYVVTATALTADGAVQVQVQTVAVASTTADTRTSPSVSLTNGTTSRRLVLAATGDHVFLAVVQGSADGDRSAHLLRSPDRGQTWEAPVDLLALAGLDDEGAVPTVSLAAQAPSLAIVVGDADEAGSLLVSDDRGASFGAPVDVDALEATAPSGAVRRPAAVATDGSSVRVAWLRGTAGSAPVLLSAPVSTSGTPAAPVTVPTAPSTFADGVGTEVVLAALGSTYSVQVEGGRLFSLDPDSAWRWPLPFEPTDSDTDCAPSCPTILPAAVYGDRLVHRGYGYFSYWFIDRIPPQLVVVEGAGKSLRPYARVTVRVVDDGAIKEVLCRRDVGGEYLSRYPWDCTADNGNRAGARTLTAVVTDLAGNTVELTHHWVTDGTGPRISLVRDTPRLAPGRHVRWSWRSTDPAEVREQGAMVWRLSRVKGQTIRRTLAPTRTSYSPRLRSGETVCIEVQAHDVLDNRSRAGSCVSAMADDRFLEGPVTTLRSRKYRGGSASLLAPGQAVRPSDDDRQNIFNWAVRVLTCPTCGSLLIDGFRKRKVDLRSSRTRFRTIVLQPGRKRRTGPPQLVASGRVIVDGYWTVNGLSSALH
ncbi:hypothetical protein [Nocardioides sp. W7]|uniref:hypothetical protein n=1 Tax=Nocardioides sp. W7 TaxID=2931390 RepID=UPI001FD5426D|nr:hypothetical protein [Nocardioides sp. W7]